MKRREPSTQGRRKPNLARRLNEARPIKESTTFGDEPKRAKKRIIIIRKGERTIEKTRKKLRKKFAEPECGEETTWGHLTKEQQCIEGKKPAFREVRNKPQRAKCKISPKKPDTKKMKHCEPSTEGRSGQGRKRKSGRKAHNKESLGRCGSRSGKRRWQKKPHGAISPKNSSAEGIKTKNSKWKRAKPTERAIHQDEGAKYQKFEI
jgi:hypothetical protein